MSNLLKRNRKPIGYGAGILNLLLALNYWLVGEQTLAALWFAIGMMFIWDAHDGD